MIPSGRAGLFSGRSGILAGRSGLHGGRGGMLAGRRGVAVFSPLDIPDLAAWFDASDTATITKTSTTTVPSFAQSTKRQIASNGLNPYGALRTTTDTVINDVRRVVVADGASFSSLWLHYANFAMTNFNGQTTDGTAQATISATVQKGSTEYAGAADLVLGPGGEGTIAISGTFSPGDVLYIKTQALLQSGSKTYPTNVRHTGMPMWGTGSMSGTSSAVDFSALKLGSGAAGTATMGTGNITAVSVSNGGQDYASAPTVYAYEVQANGVLAAKAIGTATLTGSAVTSVTVTDGTPPAGVTAWSSPTIVFAYGNNVFTASNHTATVGWGPDMITGIPSKPTRSAFGVGTSIMFNLSGPKFGDLDGNLGIFELGVKNRVGFANLGKGGIRAFDWADSQTIRDKWFGRYAPYATDAIVELGVNDPAWADGRSTSGLIADLNTIGADLRSRGLLVNFSTLTQRTQSTDSWTTTTNQTSDSWASGTTVYSSFVATVNTAITDGTVASDNNAVTTYDLFADSTDSWKWRVSDSLKTEDGLHPTDKLSASRNQNGEAIAGTDSTYQAKYSYLSVVGGAVSQWSDKSGNGRHATQGTGTSQPATGTRVVNERNVLDFDGTNDRLDLPSGLYGLLGNGASTVFAVCATDSTNQQRVISLQNGSTTKYLVLINGAGQVVYRHYSDATVSLLANVGTIGSAQHIYGLRRSGTTLDGLFDGSAGTVTTAANTSTIDGGAIGSATHDATSLPLDGACGEVIIYTRALTNAEVNQVAAYLAAKWGGSWTNI